MVRGTRLQQASLCGTLIGRPVVSFFHTVRSRKKTDYQQTSNRSPAELLKEHVTFFNAAELRRKAEGCEVRFEYIAAEKYYKTALNTLEGEQGDAFPISAAIARALSALYLKTERFAMARWYARRAMRICYAEYRPFHPESIRCLAFYGALLYELGHIRSAVRCLKRAYLRAAANESSLIVLSGDIIDLLADAYEALGNHQRAAYCERLSRRIRAEHSDTPDTLTYLENKISSGSI
jgi:tetratricopeptide (TPR) repeat protein